MADAHAGRNGRCPFCKAVVSIPIESEPLSPADSESPPLAELAAAVSPDDTDADEFASAPPPPPPDAKSADTEPELVPSADPRYKTTRLDSVDIPPDDTMDLDHPATTAPQAAPARTKRTWLWVAIGGGATLLVVAAVAVVLFGPVFGSPGAPRPAPGTATINTDPPAPPQPTTAQTHLPLSAPITLATS
ncbi:MAG TPA: hypothetical protein VFJ30_04505, partial [Phycisphaerae bacterium]|nr:hypothetical protein [Phycisphaerae bacterium]